MYAEPAGGVDEKFCLDPVPDSREASDPSGQAREATGEAGQIAEVTFDLTAELKQPLSDATLHELDRAQAESAVAP